MFLVDTRLAILCVAGDDIVDEDAAKADEPEPVCGREQGIARAILLVTSLALSQSNEQQCGRCGFEVKM